jgi:hypothetical protein
MMLTEHPVEVAAPQEQTSWASRVFVPEMWGAVAIGMIWLAVLFVGVYGPNMVFTSSNGYSNIPSVVLVALFAVPATIAVARRAFGGSQLH